MTDPDLTPEAPIRFRPVISVDGRAGMRMDREGRYVSHSDYAALSAALQAERAKPPSYRFTTANLMGSVVLGFDQIQRSDVPGACLFHGNRAVIVGSCITFDGVAIMPVPYWEAAKARAEAAEAKLKEAVAALNQYQLATAGYVSVQSARDKADAFLASIEGDKP